jgi:hypothetical protein
MEGNQGTGNHELSVDEQLAALSGPYDLTHGQLQWLLEKMSSDDQQLMKAKLKACSREMFLTRACK